MSRSAKKLFALVVFAMLLLAFFVGICPQKVEAVDPGYPANTYIKDVVVGSSADPLSFNNGGLRILLVKQGVSVGYLPDGSRGLALFAIDSWRRQTGKQWPYNWRSVDSVAWEIQLHCFRFGSTNLTRYITISFKGI